MISIFSAVLAAVAPAMGQKDARIYLNGVALYPDNGRVRVVASNGHALLTAVDEYSAWPKGMAGSVIVHREAVEFALRTAKKNSQVSFEIEGNKVTVRVGAAQCVFQSAQCVYPDWQTLLNDVIAAVPREGAPGFPALSRELMGMLAKSADSVAKRLESESGGWAMFATGEGSKNGVFTRLTGLGGQLRVYGVVMPYSDSIFHGDIEKASEGAVTPDSLDVAQTA